MQFKVKVPSKLIISGEHAVVYGKPALIIAVNKFLEASVSVTENESINLVINDIEPG